jgi:hypothetical protein
VTPDFLDDYVDVAERMEEFFEKFPHGSLQTVEIRPFSLGGNDYISYVAAAYRHDEDQKPGHGSAWEPVPGKTPYTKDSELMNAETSAWGRAVLAINAAKTKRGIASANEMRNRQYTQDTPRKLEGGITDPQKKAIETICSKRDLDDLAICGKILGKPIDALTSLSKAEASRVLDALNETKAVS